MTKRKSVVPIQQQIMQLKQHGWYTPPYKTPASTSLRQSSLHKIIETTLQKGQLPKQIVSVPPILRQQIQTQTRKVVKKIKKRGVRQDRKHESFIEDIDEYYENSKTIPIPFDMMALSIPRLSKKLFMPQGTPNPFFEKFLNSSSKFKKIDKFSPEGHQLHEMGSYKAYVVKHDGQVYMSIYLEDDHCFCLCVD